jgi:hypothetical protein
MRLLRAFIAVFVAGVATANAATRTATTCSSSDVQAAINASARGDIVTIPNGSCTWASGVTISGKGIILQGQTAAGVQITNNATFGIDITEDTIFHTEIRTMTVTGDGEFIHILPHSSPNDDGKAVLIHDITFRNTSAIRAEVNRGVIYANVVDGSGTLNQNLEFVQCKAQTLGNSWTSASTMGMADTTGESNLYIENNTLTKVLQAALDIDDNCRIVIRHNTFDNSAFSSHGADTSAIGGRHFELYENTFIFTNLGDCSGTQTANVPYFFFLRGGTGVIADNTGLVNMSSCAWGNKPALTFTVMNLQRNAGPNACWGAGTSGGAKYPAPRQIGRGYVTGTGTDGAGRTTDAFTYVGDSEPLYIWNQSSAPSLADYDSTECGATVDSSANYIRPGRDYIFGTPKPGYTKYTYPHPLRGGGGLAAPTNLRVIR